MKRIILLSALMTMVIAFGIIKLKSENQSFNNLNQEMEFIFTKFVKNNKSVRNCVLSVLTGDGSFSWTGAAGIADQDNNLPMINATPIYIASITKLYTATAVMMLYEKGLLSLDDPVSKYLPKKLIHGIHIYKGKDYSCEITVKELLSHTSGIADYYTEKPKNGKNSFEIFLKNPERIWTVEELIERVRNDLKPDFKPGTDASYSDTNYQLLGKIIELITGKPLYIIFEEYFFLPLGLKHTRLICFPSFQNTPYHKPADIFYKNLNITKIRSNGAYWADGGIISTADEMIIFLKALNKGKIIGKNTLKLMQNWNNIHQFPLQYGFGMMHIKLPWLINIILKVPPLYGHSGSTGSFLYYSEELNLYLAGTINQVESNSKSFILMQRVIKAIMKKKHIE